MNLTPYLTDPSRIEPQDVLRLRAEVFGDAVISRVEAEGVFSLNDSVDQRCNEWNMFFVEVMIDYCVNQAKPRGYISENNAEWLIDQITNDGHLHTSTELDLLVQIIEKATQVPAKLSAFALREVSNAVLNGNGKLVCDNALIQGVIGKPEAQLIRRILYGVGAEGRIAISRDEVEVLFDLNDATLEAKNHPEWTDVFVKAVACYLMKAGGYRSVSRQQAMERDEWLDDANIDVGGFLSRSLKSFGAMMRGELSGPSTIEGTYQAKNDMDAAGRLVENPIDAKEAAWLSGRIGLNGKVCENEKALLRYLKQECPAIDPLLDPLLQKVA